MYTRARIQQGLLYSSLVEHAHTAETQYAFWNITENLIWVLPLVTRTQ